MKVVTVSHIVRALTKWNRIHRPRPPSAPANIMVCSGLTSPRGSGRQRVRRIIASSFCSTRQLTAAAAPATNAMPSVPAISTCAGTITGVARNMPITAVKTMSDTTRGFVSE
jgi:hypothetical protein